MRMTRWAVMLTAACMLMACGGKGSGQAAGGMDSAGGSEAKSAPAGNASAEEVAEENRGKVRCPAKPDIPARAAGAPVDDVLGVRPGMSYDDAANIVMCTHHLLVVRADTSNRFNIESFGQKIRQGFSARFAEARVAKSSKEIMKQMQAEMFARSTNAVRQDMQPGESKWYAGAMGAPKQERIVNVAREEWFSEGKFPTMASVREALLEKYGKPTRNQTSGANLYVVWAYDPSGRLVTETSSLFAQCQGNSDPDGGSNFSPDCGLVIVAHVMSLRNNPDLAQSMQVGVIDQAGGYARITSTEQSFQQIDAQRRAKEVEEAAKGSGAPRL